MRNLISKQSILKAISDKIDNLATERSELTDWECESNTDWSLISKYDKHIHYLMIVYRLIR